MATKRHKWTTSEQAARRTSRRGWANLNVDQMEEKMNRPAQWTAREAANITRIATALEGIRAELKLMRVAGERNGVARVHEGG